MGVVSAFEGAGTVTFNNITSSSLGIYVERFPDHAFPERDYLVQAVPGRNGDVVIDTGSYKNVDRLYDVVIVSDTVGGFQGVASALNGWLHQGSGYLRLEDSYESDVYRLAMYKESNSIRNILMQAGRATIAFNCKPQCFLKSGEIAEGLIQASGTFAGVFPNPTMFTAFPKIDISWSENAPAEEVSVQVGSRTWTIAGHNSTHTIIDSMLQECYGVSGANLNGRLRFPSGYYDFPSFAPATSTTITISGSSKISGVQVTPNWWRL